MTMAPASARNASNEPPAIAQTADRLVAHHINQDARIVQTTAAAAMRTGVTIVHPIRRCPQRSERHLSRRLPGALVCVTSRFNEDGVRSRAPTWIAHGTADVEGDLRIRERQLPGGRARDSRGLLAYREDWWCPLARVATRHRRGAGVRGLGMISLSSPSG